MKKTSLASSILVGLLFSAAASAQPPDVLAMRLKPVIGADGRATGIEVRQTLSGHRVDPEFALVAQGSFEGVQHVADRVVDLKVQDAIGTVPLSAADDAPLAGDSNYTRHWRARRAVRYPVSIRYVAGVQPDGAPGGPPMGLRPSGGGLASSGGGFLLLPEVKTTGTRIDWDLGRLPRGSVGVVSAGEGSTYLPGPPSRLNDQWFLAGPAGRYDASPGIPFHAYWLGTPPFDAKTEMVWAGRAYGHLASSFGYLKPTPTYRVFIKQLDAKPFGGGTALPGAFLMSIGKAYSKGQDLTEIHLTYIHEMTHQWVGHMATDSKWFSEGLTVYYTATYGLSGGLLTGAEYRHEIRAVSGRCESKRDSHGRADLIQGAGWMEAGMDGQAIIDGPAIASAGCG